jgi:cobalamin biosynthesis protein CobT
MTNQKKSSESSASDCSSIDFDMKHLLPTECDMDRLKNTQYSTVVAIKVAERTRALLNSLDVCNKLWKNKEIVAVSARVGAILSGPVRLTESTFAILSNAIGGPLRRGLNIKDKCEDKCEDEEEEEDDEECEDEEDEEEDEECEDEEEEEECECEEEEEEEEEKCKKKKKNLLNRVWERLYKKKDKKNCKK